VRRLLVACAVVGGALEANRLLLRGALTPDIGVGRSLRPLGPITWQIAAPREVVFDVISQPYLGRTPRALEDKLQVWERATDMVLAAHFTRVGRAVATTVETVRFERPSRISFRLVRGPVPHVVESFELTSGLTGTELTWQGELGTDLWAVGRWWGNRVAEVWEATVRASLEAVAAEAERRARHAARPGRI
jgi:Polyketide cyclase / dehydrase and lipid transport